MNLSRSPISSRSGIATTRRFLTTILVVLGLLALPSFVSAQTSAKSIGKEKGKKADSVQPAGPRDYRSANFLVHTDLPADEANDLLKRLETMLTLISKYWGKPNKQTIEMFVVRDLEVWPPNSLEPPGLESIEQQAGITMTSGAVNRQTGQLLAAKSRVYAIADRGVPQHEAVHAYCHQSFGRAGPTWYSEGMAEMGHCWRGESRVHCLPIVVKYLRSVEPKPLRAIVNGREQTGDSWQNYAWRWAALPSAGEQPELLRSLPPAGTGHLGRPTRRHLRASLRFDVARDRLRVPVLSATLRSGVRGHADRLGLENQIPSRHLGPGNLHDRSESRLAGIAPARQSGGGI